MVTAIIIVRDGETHLDEAIESVLGQTLPHWELLVVDDGSTDTSRAIARRHASSDHRIRAIAHPDGRNHGMSATRNLGIAEASGAHIGFLDADDVWEAQKLAEQVAVLEDHPEAAMVYGRTLIWHSWSGRPAPADLHYDLGVEPGRVHHPPVLFRNLVRNEHQTPTTCNALVRRAVASSVGGFEERFRATFEDQVFFAKVLIGHPVFVSDREWARYRQHDDSSSARTETGDELAAHVDYLRWLRSYVAAEHRSHLGDRLAVDRALVSAHRRAAEHAVKQQLRRRRRR